MPYLRARGIEVMAAGSTCSPADTSSNLVGPPGPLGNSIESMDLDFALQARCLEAVATGAVGDGHVAVPVSRFIDEAVATAFLNAYP